MADQGNQIEREIREEIKRSRHHTPKREQKRIVPWLLLLVLTALAVLGAVGFAAQNHLTGMDSLRRFLSYDKARQSADGKTELYRYDSDRSATFESLGKSLIIVSTTRVQLLGGNGEELWSQTVNFTAPAVTVGKKTAAVYDVGGRTIYLLDENGLRRDMSGETGNGILSASLNGSDYLALTTLISGYRTTVTAYDASGAPVFTFNSSERYLTEARVLEDNRHLAAVSLGEAGGVFASTLTFYAFDQEKSVSETTFSGEMVLSLGIVDGNLAALKNERITLFSEDGSLAGSLRFEYPYLRGISLDGDGFGALLLSRYRSGNAMRIVTLNGGGEALGTLDVRREVVDISAAGKYVAVLFNDSLSIYTADLNAYATLEDTDYARRVIMRADGTALLLGASRAWLYVPK